MVEEYFCLIVDNCGHVTNVLGPYNDFEYAKDKIVGAGSKSIVTKVVTHGENEYGAPEKYQGVSYPAPLDDYIDED
jgi:hypothetical protein